MIPGDQSNIVDTVGASKKLKGKVNTNTGTFAAQEPASPLLLKGDSILIGALPVSNQMEDYSSDLLNALDSDIIATTPQDYYAQSFTSFAVTQVLVRAQPNVGTEYQSFDLLNNSGNRVEFILTPAFGSHFNPIVYKWDGAALGAQVSPVSGIYWDLDTGGFLLTPDTADTDHLTTGYYILCYVYTGETLKQTYTFSSTLTGVTTEFTLSRIPIASTVRMYINGLEQTPTTDFTVSGVTVTWVSSDFSLEAGDIIKIEYKV